MCNMNKVGYKENKDIVVQNIQNEVLKCITLGLKIKTVKRRSYPHI